MFWMLVSLSLCLLCVFTSMFHHTKIIIHLHWHLNKFRYGASVKPPPQFLFSFLFFCFFRLPSQKYFNDIHSMAVATMSWFCLYLSRVIVFRRIKKQQKQTIETGKHNWEKEITIFFVAVFVVVVNTINIKCV